MHNTNTLSCPCPSRCCGRGRPFSQPIKQYICGGSSDGRGVGDGHPGIIEANPFLLSSTTARVDMCNVMPSAERAMVVGYAHEVIDRQRGGPPKGMAVLPMGRTLRNSCGCATAGVGICRRRHAYDPAHVWTEIQPGQWEVHISSELLPAGAVEAEALDVNHLMDGSGAMRSMKRSSLPILWDTGRS